MWLWDALTFRQHNIFYQDFFCDRLAIRDLSIAHVFVNARMKITYDLVLGNLSHTIPLTHLSQLTPPKCSRQSNTHSSSKLCYFHLNYLKTKKKHAQSTDLDGLMIYKKNLDEKYWFTEKLEHLKVVAPWVYKSADFGTIKKIVAISWTDLRWVVNT